jgi:hypothetical protein
MNDNENSRQLEGSHEKRRHHWPVVILGIATFTFLTGCTSIPTKEFESYKAAFNAAKGSAQDVITESQLRAESIATLPQNLTRADVKVKQLNDRTAALQARLDALELIGNYNETLADLAAGTDPAAIQGNVEGIRDGLSQFGFKQLTTLVGNASPYTAVIAQGISIIDDLIKQKKFKDAVIAGKGPITNIVQILADDADSIHTIEEQWISFESDKERDQLTDLKFRISDLVKDYTPSDDLTNAINRFIQAIGSLNDPPVADALKPKFTFGVKATGAADLEVIKGLADEAQQHVDAYNKTKAQIEAHKQMIAEYKQLLLKVNQAIATLDSAVHGNRVAAAQSFIDQVLKLRKAILAVQNTK